MSSEPPFPPTHSGDEPPGDPDAAAAPAQEPADFAPARPEQARPEQARPEEEPLEILYLDEHLVAIHKPAGLLVHRSPIDAQETRFALQQTRDQIGRYVYPVHRLDKPTSGILVFGLNKYTAGKLGESFEQRVVEKEYLAVVRGWPEARGVIDHPLKLEDTGYKPRENAEPVPALTDYERLATVEIPHAVGPFETARYALLSVRPHTGRLHQIRRHLKHISHPVIGDVRHGDSDHNRFFREHFRSARLLLASVRLAFPHPATGERLQITCPPESEMVRVLVDLGWKTALQQHF